MKKILLSLAVIASSAAYVVYESQIGAQASGSASADIAAPDAATTGQPDLARVAPADTVPTPADALPPAAQPIRDTVVIPPEAAPTVAATPSVEPAGVDVAAAAPIEAPIDATAAAPEAVSPLPRPRPVDAPTATVAAAAAAPAAGRYRDGTFKGVSANAYYGRVQIDTVIKGGRIVAVDVLQYPNDRRTSRYINTNALPILKRETIQAQSDRIDTVSGATLTSEAFLQSLDSALASAGGNSA